MISGPVAPLPPPRPPVRGLSAEQRTLSVETFFERFSWSPPLHVVLAQWETRGFFERLVR